MLRLTTRLTTLAVILVAGKPLGSVVSQDTVAILRVGDPNAGFRPR